MTLSASTAPVRFSDATPRRRGKRPLRALRRRTAWLLLIGWVALPLLPVFGLGLSLLLGVGLF